MRNALFVLGEHHLIMDHLRRADELAERTGDTLRRGYAALHIGGWYWQQGQQRDTYIAAQAAFVIAEELGNRELTALAWYRIGLSHHASGEYRSAIEALRRCAATLEDCGSVASVGFGGYPYAFCCSFLAWSFAELHELNSAREWGLRGWQFAIERNHTYTQSVAAFGLGLCYLGAGQSEEARSILERGLELYRVGEVPVSFSWVASPLGFLYVVDGQHERGFALLREALTVDQPRLHRSQLELWHADACRLTRRDDEAFEEARRGSALAEKNGERAHSAWAERVLGDIEAARDPIVAHRHYARAIEIARPLELYAHLSAALIGRSQLFRTEGRISESQDLWNEALLLSAPPPSS